MYFTFVFIFFCYALVFWLPSWPDQPPGLYTLSWRSYPATAAICLVVAGKAADPPGSQQEE